MKSTTVPILLMLIYALFLTGCQASPDVVQPSLSPVIEAVQLPTDTAPAPIVPQATVTKPPARASETPRFVVLKSLPTAVGSNAYPLSEFGAYEVGKRTFTAVDSSRPDREISITVWYPALVAGENPSKYGTPEAEADISGAPYPLMLSSTKLARIFAPYLVSHGFTWASVDGIDTWGSWDEEMIEQPLDILFALEQVASNPPQGLEGVIDSEHAGVMGYSFDGYNALALSGARIDPQFYLASCENPDKTLQTADILFDAEYHCAPAREWDKFTASVEGRLTGTQDGLWKPMTDARIRAAMPMAGEGWLLFGERGLATVKMPVLFLVATQDELYPENARIFEHLGSQDKMLISILNRQHLMIYEPDMVPRMRHFAVAFFGYHLQGRKDYAKYFSEEFVNQQDGMVWGEYQEAGSP